MIAAATVHYNIYLEYSLREADVIKKKFFIFSFLYEKNSNNFNIFVFLGLISSLSVTIN